MGTREALQKFFQGNPSRKIRLLAAGGLLPLPMDEMLLLLVRLTSDTEPEVAAKAGATLQGWAESDVVRQLQSPECSPEILDYFADSHSAPIQETIILHPGMRGAVIAKMAAHVSAALLESLLYNRMRLIEHPEILEAIKINPSATQQILALVGEIETEFFGTKQRSYTAATEEPPAPIVEELLQLEGELSEEELALEGLPEDPEEREVAVLGRLGTMTVRQKMHIALLGNREARAVLVRDSNKEIIRCVLQSPKLSVVEVEAFAAMRHVSEDVLRHIGNSKIWIKSYAVIHNLVRNPKTPIMISQRFLIRLLAKDLTMLSRDRGVPEAVRKGAERLLKQRNAGRQS